MEAASKKRSSTPLVDRVYQEIRDRILYEAWGDGHHALVQEIAEEFGVSRTPVLQALSRLQNEGLVETIPRHGILVSPISLKDVRESSLISTHLESLAVELAASRKHSAKSLKPLEQANDEVKAAYEAADFKAWLHADEVFHNRLVALSDNRMLADVHRNFWGRAQRARLAVLSRINPPARSTGEHAEILDAIREGNPALATERLKSHFQPFISYANELADFHLRHRS